MKPLKKLIRLTDLLDRGEDSLEEGTRLERRMKLQEALMELMQEAVETEDAADVLEVLQFVRKHGVKMRHDLQGEMKSETYYPCPSVLERMKLRAERDAKAKAEEDSKGLMKRDRKRISDIGPMLPFLQPGRVDLAD